MKNEIITSLKVFAIFSILLGIIYPLTILIIAQVTMHHKANGSLIFKNKKIIGSELIGQSFTTPTYFHSRPSAVNYDASNSGASNLAPSSKKLLELAKQKVLSLRIQENLDNKTPIPAEMVLQSASGIDPHISLQNALLQVPRVSKLRNLPEDTIIQLLENNTDADLLGIWGHSAINALKLNSALDAETR